MSLPIPLLWLIAGVVLCAMEFAIPTAYVEFTMGLSALLIALLALVVPSVGIQVTLWLLLSVGLTVGMRRLLPSHRATATIADAKEAKTLTEILPGQTGRVLYEGNSWQAQCADHDVAIAPNQSVLVVGRQGNTLLVMPESSIHLYSSNDG